MKKLAFFTFAVMIALVSAESARSATWRAASENELKDIIPARAPVEKEHIETEFRTASAITDGKGKYVAGVGLITAGYAAEGKYSNFFLTRVAVKIGDLALPPGEYVFGWRRKDDDSLNVKFYDAQSGKFLGSVEARRLSRIGRVESFKILPPSEKPIIQIGRFGMTYRVPD